MAYFVSFGVLLLFVYYTYNQFTKNKKSKKIKTFPAEWRILLNQHVSFYNSLSKEEKGRFENKILEFLDACRITGIKTSVDPLDKILIASSAVIPIFQFPDWQYTNLNEILLYPSHFNHKFETTGEDRRILGMVGNGYMEGKMILSKEALRRGFQNETDKKNTAIHEFIHLIDKADGVIDGVPNIIFEKQYIIPWLDLINKKIEEIYNGNSDINPYGGTNQAEFFSVICEYFFERPKLLESKHPELYSQLEKIFKHDMTSRNLDQSKVAIGRNSPCPCDSGKKFKKCCGRVHYNQMIG
ncbi:zinc-dependent peptidase [Mangrovivirga sp. M17]|uniref:Zinc-dependent peptidase n=1 Tax=Mangrovivirga halotolerans TaxID=2993936 RepID=A0ABT3RPN6_9BACT|nr:zinc-dependent peptidase [Mangrovivirga halotolerans]MCX2743756.1 zinc-dependent peptidase [Mangrovivirga halotolerans]